MFFINIIKFVLKLKKALKLRNKEFLYNEN